MCYLPSRQAVSKLFKFVFDERVFIKKCIHLHKRALSFSLNQCSAARPTSERCRAAATQVKATQHSPAHPTTKPLKPLCQFLSSWKTISGISRWLPGVLEHGYALRFRRRPPRFNTIASHIDKLLHHLEFLGLCVNVRKRIPSLSQSITYLKMCFVSQRLHRCSEAVAQRTLQPGGFPWAW